MAAAYAVANGKPITLSNELYTAKQINRYGVLAIHGRPLTYREIVAIDTAELVRTVYDSVVEVRRDSSADSRQNAWRRREMFFCERLSNGTGLRV